MNQRMLALGGIVAAVALFLVASAVVKVREDQQAIILQLGRPVSTVNTYVPEAPFGETGAGLVLKKPFVQNVVYVDKRIRSLDITPQTVLSTDQLRLVVDAFARYRIVDPVKMYQTVRNEGRLETELSQILTSRIRNELGAQRFDLLLSPERGQSMENIQQAVNRSALAYGAEIVDVRIKRADLRPARQQEALTIRAQGARDAQIIRAEADAQAARVYAESFNKDPNFYAFYRAMQAYRQSFAQGNSSVVLSPDNEFLREFQGEPRR